MRSPHASTPNVRRIAGGIAALLVLVAACDTGDGKTLRDPTGTLPPTTPAPPATDVGLDGGDTLASLPAEQPLPAESVVDPLATGAVSADGSFQLIAPWEDGAPIDPRFTCDGDDLTPPLSWASVPTGTVEVAVAMLDESTPGETPFVHWVVAGINPTDISLSEGNLPLGAIEGLNFFGDVGYGGPCPPPSDNAHSYRITAYALNQQVELADGTPAADLLDFVQTVAIGSADVVGTYAR